MVASVMYPVAANFSTMSRSPVSMESTVMDASCASWLVLRASAVGSEVGAAATIRRAGRTERDLTPNGAVLMARRECEGAGMRDGAGAGANATEEGGATA